MKLFPQSWYENYYTLCALCQIAFWFFVAVAVGLIVAEVIIRAFIEPPPSATC